jgi:hypothetical protein
MDDQKELTCRKADEVVLLRPTWEAFLIPPPMGMETHCVEIVISIAAYSTPMARTETSSLR